MDLLKIARQHARFSGGVGKLLEELASGEKESNWDCIVPLVESGEIKNSDAIKALAHGLGILYNKYNEWGKKPHIPHGYWNERANEAKLALKQISDETQQGVSYRGFSLKKEDYSEEYLLNQPTPNNYLN